MHADAITADTALPSQYGEQNHYPQVRSGTIVTMPGPDNNPLIFPTLCGTYARRPRNGETTQLALCTSCAETRAARQRADQHRSVP